MFFLVPDVTRMRARAHVRARVMPSWLEYRRHELRTGIEEYQHQHEHKQTAWKPCNQHKENQRRKRRLAGRRPCRHTPDTRDRGLLIANSFHFSLADEIVNRLSLFETEIHFGNGNRIRKRIALCNTHARLQATIRRILGVVRF